MATLGSILSNREPYNDIVTSLPTSPYDGQEVLWRATYTVNTGFDRTPRPIWMMKWNATDGVWLCIGGGLAQVENSADWSFSAGGAFSYGAAAPDITLPNQGHWEFGYGTSAYGGNSGVLQHVLVSAAADGTGAVEMAMAGVNYLGSLDSTRVQTLAQAAKRVIPGTGKLRMRMPMYAPGYTINGTGTRSFLSFRPVHVTP